MKKAIRWLLVVAIALYIVYNMILIYKVLI